MNIRQLIKTKYGKAVMVFLVINLILLIWMLSIKPPKPITKTIITTKTSTKGTVNKSQFKNMKIIKNDDGSSQTTLINGYYLYASSWSDCKASGLKHRDLKCRNKSHEDVSISNCYFGNVLPPTEPCTYTPESCTWDGTSPSYDCKDCTPDKCHNNFSCNKDKNECKLVCQDYINSNNNPTEVRCNCSEDNPCGDGYECENNGENCVKKID